jgi:hypothetical protein
MSSNSFIRTVVKSFAVERPQTDVIYYNMYGNQDYKLDMKRLQIWTFDENKRVIHGTEDPASISSNSFRLQDCLNKTISEIVTDNIDNEYVKLWEDIIGCAYKLIETKRTTIINDDLIYVDCRPLCTGDTIDYLYGVLLIIIPYKTHGKNIELYQKKYTKMVGGKSVIYRPHMNKDDQYEYIIKKRLTIIDRFINCFICNSLKVEPDQDISVHFKTGVPYELNMSRFQIWIFDVNNICIHGSYDVLMKQNPLEYYLGKNVEELKFREPNMWKWAVKYATNLHQIKTSILYCGEMMYIEIKPLLYNCTELYGSLIILIPYKINYDFNNLDT